MGIDLVKYDEVAKHDVTDAGDRRRRRFRGSRDDLRTPLKRGHDEQEIGINPTTKWSPE
jgi:hypothetical protein